MSARAILKRYSLIIDSVKKGQKPSRKEIYKIIEAEGIKYSDSSFDRDISAIKNEFKIIIVWDRYANGYFIDFENSLNIRETLKYFEMANSALAMIDTLKDGKVALNYLSLDSSDNLTGIELIEPLLNALKTKQVVTFSHFNFQTEETKLITLQPYLLKEYQNRWFLYGYNTDTKEFFIYGIERISNLVLTGNCFVPKADYDPKTEFENIIGIATRPFIKGETVQYIILSMSQEQGRYFRSLPWHPSHKILIDSEDEFRVKLHILPNYEFAQILYKYCDKVTVLEPQWLRNHLKEKFKKSSEKYK